MNATRSEAQEAINGVLAQELGVDFSDEEIYALSTKLMTALDDVDVFFVDEDEALEEDEEASDRTGEPGTEED